jgi:hypothetical protein
MLAKFVMFSIFSCCSADLFDDFVHKDEHVKNLLADPTGTDEELFESLRFVSQSIYNLINEMRTGKKTALLLAKRLYERGYPVLFSQIFYIEKLKKFYNWVESDMRYFYSLYGDVQRKWERFEKYAIPLQAYPSR